MCQHGSGRAMAPATASLSPLAARDSEKRISWTFPDTGLAVFHGHPDVPRLFHYFLPRLVMQAKPVLCLDGANRFDPLLIARFARSRASRWPHDGPGQRDDAAAIFNERLRVARAFTCFQLTELLARAPRWLEKFPARVIVVTALPDLYFDEDVRDREATASFERALEALRVLKRLPLTTAVFSDATSIQTPRKRFFAQLLAQADHVSRFLVGEGDQLALAQEKAPLKGLPASSAASGVILRSSA